jgi:dipeptidase
MDLVRLALERAATAREAVQVITALLEQYGQGGNCGHPIPSYYNNGFLIADPGEAFVLETVGREWLLERVGGIRSLSNIYSVTDAERVSAGLHRLIRECGWSDHATPRYADVITHPNREHIGQASARRARSALLLRSRESRLDAAHMMSILRDHGVHQRAGGWNPENAAEVSLCMHAGELNRAGQTVGSWVSELYPGGAVHWVTGTAAPCISIFKPVLFPAALPSREPSLTDRFDPRTLWWRHERLHRRALLSDFAQFLQDIQAERDGLETKFRGRVSAAFNGASHGERSQVIAECWSEAEEMEDRWCSRLENQVLRADSPYRDSWVEMSHNAGMDVVSWAARFRP